MMMVVAPHWDQVKENIAEVDWNFSKMRGDETSYLTHNYHTYSSKYIPQIPSHLIPICTNVGDTVLDPFCGSGTTLVEALLSKRNSIGVDINPLACTICRAKTARLDHDQVKRAEDFAEGLGRSINLPGHMSGAGKDDFLTRIFPDRNLRELIATRDAILALSDQRLIYFLLVALSSVARRCSNLTSNFGNDLVPRKHGNGSSPMLLFQTRVKDMTERMNALVAKTEDSTKCDVREGDVRNLRTVGDESVDMIMTHPPYMASVPYAEYQKVELTLLGFDSRKLDRELIGGNRGRAELVDRFRHDMRKAFSEMYRVLKRNKVCAVVIGNPKYLGKRRLLNQEFQALAAKAGFEPLTEIERSKQDTSNAWLRTEFVQIFFKP